MEAGLEDVVSGALLVEITCHRVVVIVSLPELHDTSEYAASECRDLIGRAAPFDVMLRCS